LHEKRRALGRWLTDVRARYAEILTLMVNTADKIGLRISAGVTVELDSVVTPGRLE
jgi:hypothetical protein